MKNLLFWILLFLMVLTINNCKKKGTVTDIARIKQAEKAIIIIRNALEAHYLKHNTYPPQGADLKEVLSPFMQKIKKAEGKFESEWEAKIAPSFSEGPFYTTEDPEINFFIKARARDINRTPVAIRPSIIRKKEEENDEKKGK